LKVLAKVYAEALAGAAFEKGIAESVRKELAGFVAAFGESPDLRNFLANPAVAAEKKRGVIAALVKRLGASDTLRNLLFVVADNRRSNLLPEIQRAFEEEIYERLGMTQARVTSARELTAKEKKELAGALEQLTGKKIEAEYGLDPELIGGAVVQIGSTIYDGSVREQLNRLRARLAAE
jgi:F-type H+-transporting ATPase subunit delta